MINPYEVSKPEGFCTACQGYTTNYDNRGECREHGIEVTEEVTEVME
jgi:hypothetical protein